MPTIRASLAGTIILALLGGVGGTAAAQEAELTEAVSTTRDLSYTGDGMKLDVYAPLGAGPWPVVVVIHGASQSRYLFGPLASAIATDGAVVHNVDVNMRAPFREATDQIACAIRFARATAADHGGDPARITYVGHSAGTAIGMVVALAGDEYGEDCVVTDQSALVDVLVGYEGPFENTRQRAGAPFDLPTLQEQDPDAWRALDAYTHIGGNPDLVVRLVHGDAEDRAWYDVPLDWSVRFDQALHDAGYDTELTVVAGQGHSDIMDPASDAAAVVMQKVAEPARAPAE